VVAGVEAAAGGLELEAELPVSEPAEEEDSPDPAVLSPPPEADAELSAGLTVSSVVAEFEDVAPVGAASLPSIPVVPARPLADV
jgi:hypothetical protein